MSSGTAFVAAILVASLPLPIQAHDIYSHLRDGGGVSCCEDRDCRPALYRVTARGVQMFVDQQWIDVPEEQIQYRSLPGDDGRTGGGRGCGWALDPTGPAGDGRAHTICAVLPSDLLSDRRSAALEALAIPPLGHLGDSACRSPLPPSMRSARLAPGGGSWTMTLSTSPQRQQRPGHSHRASRAGTFPMPPQCGL